MGSNLQLLDGTTPEVISITPPELARLKKAHARYQEKQQAFAKAQAELIQAEGAVNFVLSELQETYPEYSEGYQINSDTGEFVKVG